MRMMAPWLIWALLLSLLPIVIHLLNRLRYKTVQWAAIMFLIKANQSSTRNARLRHWLILASRCLMVFFFVFLFTRPLVGGWFGSVLAGKPNTIMLLLDRSASMEAKDPRVQMTKREQAVDLWIRAANELGDTRFVLVEHVNREPMTIAGPGALKNMTQAGPTDTAADIPALLRSALEYLKRNPGERAEIWLASDLQESNWHRGSREWEALEAQFDALPQDVQFRLMAMNETTAVNTSVALADIRRPKPDRLSVSVQFHRSEKAEAAFRLGGVVDDREYPTNIELEGANLRAPVAFEIDEDDDDGWGYLELPFDQNAADNRCYFVYGGETLLRSAIVAEQPDIASALKRAVYPDGITRFCEEVARGGEADLAYSEQGLVFWQGGATRPEIEAEIKAFVEAGGVLFCLPPGDERKGLFGVQWSDIVTRDAGNPFIIERYDDIDGPLANTAAGEALPVANMSIRQYQRPLTDDRWQDVATYDDGSPFLLERTMGQGRIYLCSTLPEYSWSDLGGAKGAVPFVLMVQRMLRTGSSRLARVRTATCGEWRPADGEVWESVDTEGYKNNLWTAGVYRSGSRLVALNRPLAEDDPVYLSLEEASTLFGELQIEVVGQEKMAPNKKIYTEIWRIFLYLALAFLLFEGFLLLQERKVSPAG